jgi:hypothetical protein
MDVLHRLKQAPRLCVGGALALLLVAAALLSGCGATTAGAVAGATATPTCPPAGQQAGNFKTVNGSITSVGTGTITVTNTAGTATVVTIASTTVFTRIATGMPSDLTTGTAVQVLTDTNATMARNIRILPAGASSGAGGFGGGAGGFGGRGGNGTPTARGNPACAPRRGQGQGQGQGADQGGGQGAGFPGQGSGFQGLRGTVDSASSTKLVFDDVAGQTYSVAITSSTVIQKIGTAKASDLKTGMKVLVAGAAASGGVTARSITIQG